MGHTELGRAVLNSSPGVKLLKYYSGSWLKKNPYMVFEDFGKRQQFLSSLISFFVLGFELRASDLLGQVFHDLSYSPGHPA
jgi:hypothetical protein